MAKASPADYPEIQAILARLRGGKPSEVVALFVPSHDRKNAPVPNQKQWADAALAMFGELFEGATAFQHLRGVYQPEGEKALFDDPIMIQTLTARKNVEDEAKLLHFAQFCRRMGRNTNQAAVGVIVNNYFIDIRIPHDERPQ